jgi:hypothetical protein
VRAFRKHQFVLFSPVVASSGARRSVAILAQGRSPPPALGMCGNILGSICAPCFLAVHIPPLPEHIVVPTAATDLGVLVQSGAQARPGER